MESSMDVETSSYNDPTTEQNCNKKENGFCCLPCSLPKMPGWLGIEHSGSKKSVKYGSCEMQKQTGTRIVIAGGEDINGTLVNSTYIMEVKLSPAPKGASGEIIGVTFEALPKLPKSFRIGFSQACRGRVIIGGGVDKNYKNKSAMYELAMGKYHNMPSLNEGRNSSGICYLGENLFLSGGLGNSGKLDSVERLAITTKSNSSEFVVMNSRLPYHVSNHTLSPLNGKLVLIGGYDDSGNDLNKVWEGSPDLKNNEIHWKEMPSMPNKRAWHFSVVIDNQIFVIGGSGVTNPQVFIFNDNQWTTGPSVPCPELTSKNSAVIVTSNKQIIITTNDGLITFNPKTLSFEKYEHFKLRESRDFYVATLQ